VRSWDLIVILLGVIVVCVLGVNWAQQTGNDDTLISTLLKLTGVLTFLLLNAAFGYQILKHETGPLDLTIGVGVARSAIEIPLSSYIPILEVEDFTRYMIDLTPAQIGTSRSWYRVWLSPRFLYSHFSTAMRLSIPGVSTPDLATFSGNTFYYGGQGGFALGYRYVFFAFELTMAKISGKGTATAMVPGSGGMETIAGDANLDGFVIYPTFGFIGEF